MKDFFHPTDFINKYGHPDISPKDAAEVANRILNEYLESCPVVDASKGKFPGIPDVCSLARSMEDAALAALTKIRELMGEK
jgi:hypothetical protein